MEGKVPDLPDEEVLKLWPTAYFHKVLLEHSHPHLFTYADGCIWLQWHS